MSKGKRKYTKRRSFCNHEKYRTHAMVLNLSEDGGGCKDDLSLLLNPFCGGASMTKRQPNGIVKASCLHLLTSERSSRCSVNPSLLLSGIELQQNKAVRRAANLSPWHSSYRRSSGSKHTLTSIMAEELEESSLRLFLNRADEATCSSLVCYVRRSSINIFDAFA